MVKHDDRDFAEFIETIHINGLNGRVLSVSAPTGRKREILLLYGIHATLERMFGMSKFFNQFGAVTVPDLPGMGGMDSFYRIGQKPTLDTMADYLAAFLKLQYKRKKVTIIASSLSFAITTRMLQRYPDMTDKIEMLVSLSGFAHQDDFKFKRRDWLLLRAMAAVFSNRLMALFWRYVILWSPFIRLILTAVSNRHIKMKGASRDELRRRIAFEIILWHRNDVRTYMRMISTMLTINLCTDQVHLPVWHVAAAGDQYFNNHLVEQHLLIIYDRVTLLRSDMLAHMPTIIAEAEEVEPFIPKELQRLLRRQP